MPRRPNTLEDVWARIQMGHPDDCWPFIGAPNTYGYGQVNLNGKQQLVHRLAYAESTGEDLGELHVCHSCDNPLCCNPGHLFLGTNADNMRDASLKGRLRGVPKLTLEQVREIRDLFDSGVTFSAIAPRFGVTPENVSYICRRITWRHV
jgi:hypothetical protein